MKTPENGQIEKRLNIAQSTDKIKSVFTPLVLSKEMVDKINVKKPKNILVISDTGLLIEVRRKWKNSNILFLCHTKETQSIADQLKILSIYVPYDELSNWLNTEIDNIMNKEHYKFSEHFDLIVINPSFKFWEKFIKLSHLMLKGGGFLASITPTGILGDANKIYKKYIRVLFRVIYINLSKEVSNSFGVGGSHLFCLSIFQKLLPDPNEIPMVKFDEACELFDIHSLLFKPIKSSSIHAWNIAKKLSHIGVKLNWQIIGKFENGVNVGTQPRNIKKYYIAISKGRKTHIEINMPMTELEYYIAYFDNKEEAEIVAHNLNLLCYAYLRWFTRSAGWLSKTFENIPIKNDKKYYNSEHIINLSPDEKNFLITNCGKLGEFDEIRNKHEI